MTVENVFKKWKKSYADTLMIPMIYNQLRGS